MGERLPDTLVDTAVSWAVCMSVRFILAADRLWANVQNGRRYVQSSARTSTVSAKYAETGWIGYECNRWEAWKQGLEEARAACTGEARKKLIEDALRRIYDACDGG